MGVIIEGIRFSNEFAPEVTDYPIGNVGDKVSIEIDFRAEEVFITSDDAEVDRIILAPQPYRVNTTSPKDVIFCESPDFLVNFREGDDIALHTTIVQINYTIYEKISDQAFRVHLQGGSIGDTDFYADNGNAYDYFTMPANAFIAIITDLTAINYRWNFVKNSAGLDFNNPIDGQENRLSVGGVDTVGVGVPMIFSAPVTNNIGSAVVTRNTGTLTAQKFTIVHDTFITPYFLGGELTQLKSGDAPDYLFSGESLKHILSIDVGRNISDPNYIETIDYQENDGNVGWYGENFNGGNTNYSIESITHKRLDTSVIDAVELVSVDQTVEIVIKNTTDNPFSDTNTDYVLNFSIAPEDEAEYTLNGKTIIENFYFDRAFNTVGSGTVAGDNLGTDSQIIKDVSAIVGSTAFPADTGYTTITATLSLSAAAVADLSARLGIEYYFWVTTQNHTLGTEEADKISLNTEPEPFFVDLTDDGMVDIATKFLYHFESDTDVDGHSTINIRPEDDVLCRTLFSIDREDRTTDDIEISSISVSSISKKVSGEEFTLESFNQGFNGSQVIGDSQYISTSSERSFQMPDSEQRKTISVERRSDLDTTYLRYYEIKYPFLVRWEYWKDLAGTDGDVFDTGEPNNGQNQQWQRYDTLTDWDLFYRVTVNCIKNGNSLTYQKDVQFTSFDYLEDADWTNETIVALDADTDTPIGNLLINPTKIKASKDYAGTNPPALADVEWVVRIETFEVGGSPDIRYLSSVYDWSQYSWFKSVDSSNKVVKSLNGSTYSAEVLIDSDKLPDNAKFSISARIYNEIALSSETCYLLTEGGEPIDAEDGNNLIPEDCAIIPPVFGKMTEDGIAKLLEDGTNKFEE